MWRPFSWDMARKPSRRQGHVLGKFGDEKTPVRGRTGAKLAGHPPLGEG